MLKGAGGGNAGGVATCFGAGGFLVFSAATTGCCCCCFLAGGLGAAGGCCFFAGGLAAAGGLFFVGAAGFLLAPAGGEGEAAADGLEVGAGGFEGAGGLEAAAAGVGGFLAPFAAADEGGALAVTAGEGGDDADAIWRTPRATILDRCDPFVTFLVVEWARPLVVGEVLARLLKEEDLVAAVAVIVVGWSGGSCARMAGRAGRYTRRAMSGSGR
jgi:hypothetical protein